MNVRTRARARFTVGAPGGPRGRAGGLRADGLRARRAAARAPADPRAQAARQHEGHPRPRRLVYLRCRLDIPFPILEVAREPAAGNAGLRRAAARARAAAELVEQLNSLFGLRHCGRALPRRSTGRRPTGQMGRCLSPCLGDLDPNLYRERLDGALRCSSTSATAARAARPRRRADAAARGPPLRGGGVAAPAPHAAGDAARARSAASCARSTPAPGSSSAAHPEAAARADAVWIVGGRMVDWARLPGARAEGAGRTVEALRAAPGRRPRRLAAPDELGEVRIVGGLAGRERGARARAPAGRWPREGSWRRSGPRLRGPPERAASTRSCSRAALGRLMEARRVRRLPRVGRLTGARRVARSGETSERAARAGLVRARQFAWCGRQCRGAASPRSAAAGP